MQTRTLGNSDLELTTVGLGTWAIGGGDWKFGWGPQDDSDSIASVREALDAGINWIDTAAVYGLGRAEEVIGRALADLGERPIVATKCGLVWNEGETVPFGRLTAKSVRREAEASLRRLDVEPIDLYQIHWPNPEEEIEEAWDTISRLVDEGKLRYAGVSNFSVAQLKRIQPIHPVTSLQPPYSMLARGVEDELLSYCAENGIGVIAYSPMQAGLLTGKYDRQKVAALPENDWRKGSERFQEPQLSANLALVDGLRPIAERNGRSLGQLAIAWVLRRPEVTAAIVGARRPGQIGETAASGDWNLSKDDIEEIDALLEERERAL